MRAGSSGNGGTREPVPPEATGRISGTAREADVGGDDEVVVKFDSVPPGAVVNVDGAMKCQSTPCSKSLPSGDHSLPLAFTSRFVSWQLVVERAGATPLLIQPVPMLMMLAWVLAAWVFLSHMVAGRQVYAVGGNEEAARFSGIAINRVKLRMYALSGLSAGLAGLVSTGFYVSANTATGEGYELMVIAAAVVGGASLTGGFDAAPDQVDGWLALDREGCRRRERPVRVARPFGRQW